MYILLFYYYDFFLKAIWRADLECFHIFALLPAALWNSGGSDVWHVQSSLRYK